VLGEVFVKYSAKKVALMAQDRAEATPGMAVRALGLTILRSGRAEVTQKRSAALARGASRFAFGTCRKGSEDALTNP